MMVAKLPSGQASECHYSAASNIERKVLKKLEEVREDATNVAKLPSGRVSKCHKAAASRTERGDQKTQRCEEDDRRLWRSSLTAELRNAKNTAVKEVQRRVQRRKEDTKTKPWTTAKTTRGLKNRRDHPNIERSDKKQSSTTPNEKIRRQSESVERAS